MKYSLILILLSLSIISCRKEGKNNIGKKDVTASIDKKVLFEAGKEGYRLYRIPGIITTVKGTILAWCEARKESKEGVNQDWTTIDIMMRRSEDGGATWGERVNLTKNTPGVPKNPVAVEQGIGDMEQKTHNNAVLIPDAETGEIHLIFCIEYFKCFYSKSSDDGLTFSDPVDITPTFESFKSEYDWRVIATGPGHGIQLENGRLVIPVWMSDGTGGNAHRPSWNSVIYSDDHGLTWERGEFFGYDSDSLVYPNETMGVELSNGLVMMIFRHETDNYLKGISYSADGATNWTQPIFHPELYEPVCFSSVVRYSMRPDQSKNRILFCNPDSRGKFGERKRENLTIKMSYDEGFTWPVTRTLHAGPGSYSDMTVDSKGNIYCLYENGQEYHSEQLTVAKFNLDWLTDRNSPKDFN